MSLGGEKVFAHLSWKQSKKKCIRWNYFPLFSCFWAFQEGAEMCCRQLTGMAQCQQLLMGQLKPVLSHKCWQPYWISQLTGACKTPTFVKIQKEHENTIMPEPVSCLLPHSKVCINLLNDLLILEDVINCNCLKSVCRVLLIEMVLDLRGSANFVFLLIFFNVGFGKVLPFSVIWKLFAKYYRGGIGPEGFGQFRVFNEIELAPLSLLLVVCHHVPSKAKQQTH